MRPEDIPADVKREAVRRALLGRCAITISRYFVACPDLPRYGISWGTTLADIDAPWVAAIVYPVLGEAQ